MSHNYSGNPLLVTTPLVRNIVNVFDGGAGIIVVQTSVAHLFADNDIVLIAGVTGTTEANGTFSIHIISSNTFQLDTGTFINPYTGGGTVTDQSLTPYFQVPDDGEPGVVRSILAAIEALADRTQFLQKNSIPFITQVITVTSGAFSPPVGAHTGIIYAAGGGGGGGSGGLGAATTSIGSSGGGGGGGAMSDTQFLTIVNPSMVLVGVVGAGGIGGVAATPTDGADGGDSYLLFGSIKLAWFKGAQGGSKGAGSTGATYYQALGGMPVRSSYPRDYTQVVSIDGLYPNRVPQAGGNGTTVNSTFIQNQGNDSVWSTGGNPGTNGLNDGSTRGGGKGGGGGAGPGGHLLNAFGGNGGLGGSGHAATAGEAGGVGGTALVNTAGGGGGGGGGGAGNAGFALGGAGGDGGSGHMVILWIK